MLISDIIAAIEQEAPLSLQESYDNAGMQVGDKSALCTGVLLCVDVTPSVIDEAIERGSNLHDLADYAVVQINDTHPTMVIPELIRLLTTEHGIEFDEAVTIVRSMVAYTNHTILCLLYTSDAADD